MTPRSTSLIVSAALIGACAAAHGPASLPPLTPDCVALGARVAAYPDSFRIQPPTLVSMAVPPWDRPRSVEGKTFQVSIQVGASGEVVKDSTIFVPEVAPPSFRRVLVATVSKYRFRPAMVEGCRVAGVASATIGFDRRP